MDTKHQWVPVEECGELEEGWYITWSSGRRLERVLETRLEGGLWHCSDRQQPTHVLNPAMGPTPEAQ